MRCPGRDYHRPTSRELTRKDQAGRHLGSSGSNASLRAPHTGQTHVAGMSSNAVPGGIPPSGSPSDGS